MPPPNPSDRARKSPVSGYGADTISLRGPTTERFLRELPNKRIQQMIDDQTGEVTDRQSSGQTVIEIGRTMVRVYGDRRNEGPEIGIEFSAPTVLHGHNGEPLPLVDLPDVVEGVVWDLGRQLVDIPSIEHFRPMRLDVARDFEDVQCIERTLLAISALPVARARHSDRLQRGITGQWQSLTRGNSDRWLVRGYDKAGQMRQLAQHERYRRELLLTVADQNVGRFRWELELKADLLREKGFRTVTDLTPERIDDLAQSYFHRSRFGDVIGGASLAQDTIQNLLNDGRQTDVRGMLALLGAGVLGVKVPYSRNKEQEYRSLAKSLHLSSGDLISSEQEPRRLDFWAGEELVGMDAVKGFNSP